jgi:hypothetical protein
MPAGASYRLGGRRLCAESGRSVRGAGSPDACLALQLVALDDGSMPLVRFARLRASALVAVGVVVLSACSSDVVEVELHDGPQYAEVEGFDWPLTVERIGFECPGGNQLVIVTEDGTQYAGNGLAKDGGYADIDPIWKDDPDFAGLKVGIGELIEWGNTTCGY